VLGVITQDPPGAAIIVSGRTGRVLQIGYGEVIGDFVGRAVAGCGDVDGDGVPDFAGGTSSCDVCGVRGVIRMFSGRTGQPLFTWSAPPPLDLAGGRLSSRGLDFDRDGIPDLAVGVPQAAALLSGRDGAVLWRIDDGPSVRTGMAALKTQH
jgi:hypothetical protein